MRCGGCQQDNPGGARFCMHCGAPLAGVCLECGTSLPEPARFCPGCGNAAAQARPERDPRDYTPRHLAEKILRSRAALEGERKQVTVLFVDITSSLELSAQVDSEEWHRILDRFLRILTDGVHRFEGTVNQYTGDGIMALFGAPIAHEDHAQRACFAALHLSGRLRRYAQALKRERGLSLSVRMGLNSGEVIVGKIGDDYRMDYTAQGHSVGLAARMQALASPNTAYLSEHTERLVRGFFDLENLGQFQVRGVADPVGGFQLLSLGRLRTRLDLARSRGFSRFVGRADEMRLLEGALERAVAGQGEVLSLVGDPGIGKSRLFFELAELCRARDIAVREAHGVSHGRMIPFLPVQQLMRGYFGIGEEDADETARDKIAGRVVRLDPELSESLPLLFGFFGVPDPSHLETEMSAEARERRLFSVIRRLVHARSERRPALIVIEDLHWIDGASERFVQNLAESVAGTCTLMLVNHRPEYASAWLTQAGHRVQRLEPLAAAATDELLDELLGTHASVLGLGRLIRERAQGNPFFIEELVQSLVEAGSLEGSRGAYELIRPIEALAIAPTVQAVLAARIDRLAERDKQVLHTAAVLGKGFSESLLAPVSGLSEEALAQALRALLDANLLVEESLYPERELAFRHPLTHEVAYSTQLLDHRRRVHATVAETLEAQHAERLDERAALLAHHWEGAGEPLAAARWHQRAARFVGAHHFAEATRHWLRVRELLDGVPESQETLTMGVEARGQLIVAAGRLGEEPDAVDAVFAEAEELARRSENPSALVRTLLLYGYFQAISGELGEAQRLFSEARGLVEATGDADLAAAAHYLPIYTRVTGAGHCAGMLPLIDEALAATDADPDAGRGVLGFPPRPVLKVFRSVVQGLAGARPDAIREVRSIARDRDLHPACQLMGSFFAVLLAEAQGESSGAMQDAGHAVDLAETLGLGEGYARVSLGRALLLEGAGKQAEDAFRAGLEDVRARRTYLHLVPGFLVGLSRARLARDDAEGSLAAAREAVAWTEGRGLYAADARLALANALLAGSASSARAEIEGALAQARSFVEATGVLSRRAALAAVEQRLENLGRDGRG